MTLVTRSTPRRRPSEQMPKPNSTTTVTVPMSSHGLASMSGNCALIAWAERPAKSPRTDLNRYRSVHADTVV